jgi:hypothetical protein
MYLLFIIAYFAFILFALWYNADYLHDLGIAADDAEGITEALKR